MSTTTTRYYPADNETIFASGTLTGRVLDDLREAGFEVCLPKETCDAHPDQPPACYLCL